MSRDYWENRYQTGETTWDKGAPSPGLVDFLAQHRDLKKGIVAVPGCGAGHDVREFAQAGFAACGFDIAPSAIARAEEKSRAAKLAGTVKFQLADFLHDSPPQKFDWLFEHTLFCAIQPSERDDYVRAVLRWLKPGGTYLAVNYIITEDENGPPWPVTREELVARFSPHFDLQSDWVPRSYPNRTDRERMFWWTLKG
ncbi:MAG TPA: methyltransferase domain-containing protein [Verrucomicrobiae bacterium]